MSRKNTVRAMVLCIGAMSAASPAWCDLYQADEAIKKQDFPRAFELYRELAELGQPSAQENLAVMYVSGEGVKRDNVLGYAWAKLALANGGGEAARDIIAQLEPRMTDAARAQVASIDAQFGNAALLARILPIERSGPPFAAEESSCKMASPADPDQYYPPEARQRQISGSVLIEAPILPDGSVRAPRVWYSMPATLFDDAARAVALASHYRPKSESGAPVACSLLFKVKFSVVGAAAPSFGAAGDKAVAELKEKAERGDPVSQLRYGVVLSMHEPLNKAGERTSHWFLKAAQAGIAPAQYLVGIHLLHGGGFQEDKSKGAFWLERGAKGGSSEAQTALAIYLLRADADAAQRARGFEWLQQASSRNAQAKLWFASLLASWPDVARRDPARALALLDELGHSFDYDPASYETRAAALAGQGDFDAAKRAQQRAVSMAKRLGWDATAQKARLAAYEKKELGTGELILF